MTALAKIASPFAETWAKDIASMWTKSAEMFFKIGKRLLEAEEALDRMEFAALIGSPDKRGKLPFSYSVARRLMAVGQDERLARCFAHGQNLPPCWRTLHEISRLSDEQFSLAVERGVIHGDTERGEIELLRHGFDDREPEDEPPPEPKSLAVEVTTWTERIPSIIYVRESEPVPNTTPQPETEVDDDNQGAEIVESDPEQAEVVQEIAEAPSPSWQNLVAAWAAVTRADKLRFADKHFVELHGLLSDVLGARRRNTA